MDYEKKYKEMVKKVENLRGYSLECNNMIDKLLLELKEPDDEWIRKELIEYLNDVNPNSPLIQRWIAWLEKQDPKKHEEELEKAYKCADGVQYRKGYEDAKCEIEKQGEPQPYRGNADIMRKNLIKAFKSVGSKHWGGFDVRDIIHFLESKDAIELEKQSEQKPAWSEEDEGDLYLTIWLLDKFKEKAYTNDCENCINWLKSLKPQSHWKPTEEQMEDLKYAINMVDKCYEDSLQSLYNNLKKL